jgi:hypothetical protein
MRLARMGNRHLSIEPCRAIWCVTMKLRFPPPDGWHEEAGWRAPRVRHVVTEDIPGDSCRRGSDAHRWHAYVTDFDPAGQVRLNEEGVNPRWLTLDEALTGELTYPVRYLVERYRESLL